MPPPPGKLGDVCVWIVSIFLFLSILSGGALLVLYITLPESQDTIAYAVAGMVLVALPWAFWIMTCFYRSMTLRGQAAAEQTRVVPAQVTGNGAAENNTIDGNSPVGSPGGQRNGHFGGDAMENEQEAGGGGAGVDVELQDTEGGRRGGPHATAPRDDASSLGSRESEIPLALSMS